MFDRLRFSSTACIFGSFILFWPLTRVQAATPSIVINEIAWAGSAASASDEWIELYNMTDADIPLAGWKLTKKSSGVEKDMLIFSTGIIPARGYFLLSHFPIGASSVLQAVPDLVSSDISLVNSALQIKLYDGSGTVIDTADDGSGAPLAGRNDATLGLASMERNPTIEDGSLDTSWHTSSGRSGFLPTAREFGTAKDKNSNSAPVAEGGAGREGVVGVPLLFTAEVSADPERDALTFAWDFGDGTIATTSVVEHSYAAAGTYRVVLSVSDGALASTDEFTVIVTEVPTDLPVTPTIVAHCASWQLTSLLPNPVGSDTAEEIIIKNTSTVEQAPIGCVLRIGMKSVALDGVPITPSGQVVRILHTTVAYTLGNGGATVAILDVDGMVLDTTTYPTAKEGVRWERTATGWRWNVAETKKTLSKVKTAVKKREAPATLEAVQALSSGTLVTIRGVTTTTVGALGERMVVLEDASGALFATLAKGHRPVPVGALVTLTGVVRTRDGRRWVFVDDGGVVVGRVQLPKPRTIAIADVTTDDSYRLVQFSGVITAVSGSRFELDDGSDVLSVVIKSTTGIVRPRMTAGDTVHVVGILIAGTAGMKLYPRMQEDISVARVLGAQTSSPTIEQLATSTQPTWWYWAAAATAAVLAGLWSWWRRRRSEA